MYHQGSKALPTRCWKTSSNIAIVQTRTFKGPCINAFHISRPFSLQKPYIWTIHLEQVVAPKSWRPLQPDNEQHERLILWNLKQFAFFGLEMDAFRIDVLETHHMPYSKLTSVAPTAKVLSIRTANPNHSTITCKDTVLKTTTIS